MRLDEALIKVPEQTFAEMTHWVTEQVLCWCAEQLSENRTLRNNNDLVKEIDELCDAYGVARSTVFDRAYNPKTAVEHFMFHDIAPNYPKNASDKITVGINWDQRSYSIIGKYIPSKTAIIVYPLALEWFSIYPRIFPGNIQPLLREIRNTLRHELSHAVQFLSLAAVDPRQVEKSHSIDANGTKGDYYISPIEYGPTLESDIDNFVDSIETKRDNNVNYNLGNDIRVHVGMKKGRIFDIVSTSPFFFALKKSSEERYRRAVSVFAKEVTQRLMARQPK